MAFYLISNSFVEADSFSDFATAKYNPDGKSSAVKIIICFPASRLLAAGMTNLPDVSYIITFPLSGSVIEMAHFELNGFGLADILIPSGFALNSSFRMFNGTSSHWRTRDIYRSFYINVNVGSSKFI